MKKFLSFTLILLFMLSVISNNLYLYGQATLPTKDNPLIIDKKNKRVLIYTEINVMHLYQPTVHWGVVSKMEDLVTELS